MDPLTAGIISGGAGLIGTAISNRQSSDESKLNRDYQERLSNTSHQREVKDLRSAGLNPILSALGAGASTPGGSTASINDLGPGISKGMDTAIAVKNMKKDFELKDANIGNINADTGNKDAERSLMNAQINSANYDAAMKAAQTKTMMESLPHMLKKAKAEGDYSEINQLMGVINSGTSSAADLLGMGNQLGGLVKGLMKNGIPDIKRPKGFNESFGKPLKFRGN